MGSLQLFGEIMKTASSAKLKTPKQKQFNILEVFLGDTSGNQIPILGNAEKTPDVPESNPDYVFCKMALTDYLMFRNSGATALKIIGHTGTGKSSFVEEFNARLNLPLYVCNAHPRTTREDLIGGFVPTESGGLEFNYGPVALAAMNGCDVLIDEWNLIDPGEASGVNDLLEGRSTYVREIKGWIHPVEGFRIIATVNPKTAGYVGRNTQDVANDDRFVYMHFDYMKAEYEINLIKKLLTSYSMSEAASIDLAQKFRLVAEKVRNEFVGNSDSASALDLTISTRSLLAWVKYFVLSKNIKKAPDLYEPIHYALERAKTFNASPESRIAIHNFTTQAFGFEYVTPLNPKT